MCNRLLLSCITPISFACFIRNLKHKILYGSVVLLLAMASLPALSWGEDFTSTNVPLYIGDYTINNSTLTVPSGTGLVTDLNVNIDLTHTWIADLQISLLHSNSSTSVTLFNYSCGSADNIRGIFDDAGVFICGNNNSYISFLPAGALSIFNGINPAGNWTLTVRDDAGADQGWLWSWGLSITGFSSITDLIVDSASIHDLVGANESYSWVRLINGSIIDTGVTSGLLTANSGYDVRLGTISANLAGGALTKTTSGLVTLSGTNTYTGGTFLNGGILSVSSNSNLGNASGALNFDGGILQVTGTTFTSTPRTITWGSNGGGFDIADVANTFTVNQALTGVGGLTKSGAGILTLTGTNTYTGDTTIDAGTLVVNGSIAGNVQNNLNGTLKGTGSIGGSVATLGTIAPGNSIGTLTVGSYVSNVGSTYEAEVDAAGNSDLIDATGSATINGGDVDVLASGVSGDYARRTFYTIVDAGSGVTGTYDAVTSNLAELTPVLYYDDPNLVQLLLMRNDIDFGAIADARTDNQKSVANVLTTAGLTAFTGDMANVLDLFVDGLTTEERRSALDELGGQKLHTAVPMVAFSMIEAFQKTVGNRMSRLHQSNRGAVAKADPLDGIKLAMAGDVTNLGPIDKQGKELRNLWVNAYGVGGSVDGDKNAAGYDYAVSGAAFGIDFPVAKGTHLGLTAGYGKGRVKTDLSDNADIQSLLLSVYGNYENGPFYLDGMLTYADNSYNTDRSIEIGPLSRTAKGDYNGKEWAMAAEIGYVGAVGSLTVQPFLGTRFMHLNEDGFTEKDAGDLNLKIDSRTASSWKAYSGVKISSAVKAGEKSLFVPELSIKFVRELNDINDTVKASFVGAPLAGSFRVEGIDISRNSVEVGTGFKIINGSNNLQFGLDFGAEINSDRIAYIGGFGIKYMW